ncbi:DUF1272 domain-containing protein [Nisaea sp.]|uniref:DUF1272 domain-containing protein n=1 Tax=Nisaea sp. TaxID=2024842 RepID=UPI003B51D751
MVALEIRPNCELCDRDLPPDSPDARICSYECTYCADCVEHVLCNVCPTCGGNFVPRPIRPLRSWRPELKLGREFRPPSEKRVHSKYDRAEIDAQVARIRGLAPEDR